MPLSRRDLLLGTVGIAAVSCTSGDRDLSAGEDATTTTNSSSTSSVSPTTDSTSTDPAPTTSDLPAIVASPEWDGDDPFLIGIASGDPDSSSVVLWTRLLASAAGERLRDGDLPLALDVSLDESFEQIVISTLAEARSAFGHSAHALIDGLAPNTWFYYRFRIGDHTSPTGRTRTLPPAGADAPDFRFGFSSCQNWESGAYGAHRHLAAEDLDLFVWLGDYIYEYGPGNGGVVASTGARLHNSDEVTTLEDYRQRYALYKSDPHLQAHHAARPWLVTWDDHEVDNNHASGVSEDGQDAQAFHERRSAAYQAWWEHNPVRLSPPAEGEDFIIYRSIDWGNLVSLHMLDGRQFRSPQVTDGEPIVLPGLGDLGIRELGETTRDPAQSMLGSTQREWLEQQVQTSNAVWNVLGNQVYMHGLDAFPGEVPAINTDTWDGYFGERQELLGRIGGIDANLVVLSGDFHSSSAADVRTDPFDLTLPIVATEFMAPAISSTFPESLRGLAPVVLAVNPQVRHFSPENGYMICHVSEELWTTELRLLADVTDEDTEVSTAMTFTVNSGTAGIATLG